LLKMNGDAIYGTRPWTVYGEGPTKVAEGPFHDTETKPYTAEDFRFTKKGDTLYAIELGWPANHEAVIHALGTSAPKKVKSVALLGGADLSFEQREDGLHIQVPEQAPGKFAYAYRIGFN
jgi:alpha-L-fucosidase